MKRTVIAWVLLGILALGATPALAAAPARDLMDLPDPDGGVVGSMGDAPNQSIVSVSGGAFAADGAAGARSGNTPPVAENQELETYRGVSVGGQLTAHDAEGDELTFAVATDPMKGTVHLSPDGRFVYTPAQGKRGKDYFGFRATDSAGNVSQEGTVIIRLIKQKSKVTYSDMTGDGSEYAAVVLTEKGVFTGEYVGGEYVFRPGQEVSRGEFLTMCMTAAKCDLLKGVSTTGFLDDDAIGSWLKPYVATALMHGYIQGEAAAAGASFQPEDPVTVRDACVTLNAVLGVTDVVSAAAYVGQERVGESWAQAVANLTACGIVPRDWEDVDAVLTRSGAAELLAAAIGLITGR